MLGTSTYTALAKDMKRKERAIARLRGIDKRETQFLSVARHQLRTPLTVIIWTLKALLEDPACAASPKTKEMITDMHQAAQNMVEIIDDFLGILTINPRALTLTKRQISLHRIIEEILKRYETRIKEKKLKISYRPHPLFLIGDKIMLTEALRHIFSNAICYTPEKGSIKITLTDEGKSALVTVADTGIGIKKTDAEKIYLKYYRGKNAIEMKPGSSGLGLYVARPIIRAHKGELWFESVLGTGTSFYARLPKEN